MIALMNAIAADLHVADPLVIPEGHDKAAVARNIGKDSGWKFAYAQRLGEASEDAVKNVRKQYLKRLKCNLHYCETLLERPDRDEPTRKFRYIPVAIQDSVAEADFEVLKSLANANWTAAYRCLAEGQQPVGLTPIQIAVLAECHRLALLQYSCPVFNQVGLKASDTFVVQLRLEERMFLGYANQGKKLFSEFNAGLQDAFGTSRQTFTWPLELTAFHGSGGFTLPVCISQTVYDDVRRGQQADVSALMLEIGPDTVRVRATIRLPRRTLDVAKFSRTKRAKLADDDFEALAAEVNAKPYLLARDVNLINTLAHAVVKRDSLITVDRLKEATYLTKTQSKDYLESHRHDESNLVMAQHFSGRNFIDHVAKLASFIDTLRSKIDKGYDKVREIKRCLIGPLGLNRPDQSISESATHSDPFVQSLIQKFFRLLARIRQLKGLRVEQYRRIASVKHNWFGWVTNREVELAVQYDAAVVREEAGFVQIPKDDPKYEGRAFNRLLRNGSRGWIEQMASDKLAWFGIPEVKIPSFYTSTTDGRHGVVDKEQRKSEVFKAKQDGMTRHADEHAAVTIGNWLLMEVAT